MEFSPGVVAVAVAYAFGTRLVYYDQRAAAVDSTETKRRDGSPTMSLRIAAAGYVVAATVIPITAPLLASAAGELAAVTGLGGTFVGTTLVALATSLPELVATLTAVRMGSFDLAIGNVFGSNAFNMLLLAPLDLAQPGSLLAAVSTTHALTCLAVILITSVVILGQLYRVERRVCLSNPTPDSWLCSFSERYRWSTCLGNGNSHQSNGLSRQMPRFYDAHRAPLPLQETPKERHAKNPHPSGNNHPASVNSKVPHFNA